MSDSGNSSSSSETSMPSDAHIEPGNETPPQQNSMEQGPAQEAPIPMLSLFAESSPQSPYTAQEPSRSSSMSNGSPPALDPNVFVSTAPPCPVSDFALPAEQHFQPDVVVRRRADDAQVHTLLDYIQTLVQRRQDGGAPSESLMNLRQTGIIFHQGLRINHGSYRRTHEYTVIKNVGRGTFGEVNICQDTDSGMIFACKQVSLLKFVRREVEVLLQLQTSQHDEDNRTPTLYGILVEGDVVYIYMQFIENTWTRLAQWLHMARVDIIEAERIITHLLRQLLEALQELHMLGIRHCDVKPDNLGCTDDLSRSYLMDFGTVRVQMDAFTTKGMTPHYMSPEACMRTDHTKIDIWAAAASVLYMYTQQHPWSQDIRERPYLRDFRELLNYIATNGHLLITRYLQSICHLMSDRLFSLLRNMLLPDVNERWSAEQCLEYLDNMDSRLSSTSGPPSYSAPVPTTVAASVLSNNPTSSQMAVSALAETIPCAVDSVMSPIPHNRPYPLKRLVQQQTWSASSSANTMIQNDTSQSVSQQGYSQSSASSQGYTAQLAGCRITEEFARQDMMHYQSQNPPAADWNPQTGYHRQQIDTERDSQMSQRQGHHTRKHTHKHTQKPYSRLYSRQQSSSEENMVIEPSYNQSGVLHQAQRPSGMHTAHAQLNSAIPPHFEQYSTQPQYQLNPNLQQQEPIRGAMGFADVQSDSSGVLDLTTRENEQGIPQSVQERRESSESNASTKSHGDTCSNTSSKSHNAMLSRGSSGIFTGGTNSTYGAVVPNPVPVPESSSGFQSMPGPSRVTVMIEYNKPGLRAPTRAFSADPKLALSDVWQSMLRAAGELIGNEAVVRGVCFKENGEHLLKGHMTQHIQRDRHFFVYLLDENAGT